MPNVKLKDGTGIERTYNNVDTITLPLADGTGNWTYGLTDEQLEFDNLNYALTNKSVANLLIDTDSLNRIKVNPIISSGKKYIDISNMTTSNTWGQTNNIDLSQLHIDVPSDTDYFLCAQAFDNLSLCTTVPVLNFEQGANPCISTGNTWNNSNTAITDTVIYNFINHFTRMCNKGGLNSSYGNWNVFPFAGYMYGILDARQIGTLWHSILNSPNSEYTQDMSLSQFYYNNCFSNTEYVIAPILTLHARDVTSNYHSTCYGMALLKSFKFATNNGTPLTVNWKSQTIDFSNNSTNAVGCKVDSITSNTQYITNNPILKTSAVNLFTSNNMTIEEAQARYALLKNEPYWYSHTNTTVTYNGASVKLAMLFSRYNHTSAVETINSLPDTHAFGTNIIKFSQYSGALTDGGAIGNLTAEEIAVATAKGWTVTLV